MFRKGTERLTNWNDHSHTDYSGEIFLFNAFLKSHSSALSLQEAKEMIATRMSRREPGEND